MNLHPDDIFRIPAPNLDPYLQTYYVSKPLQGLSCFQSGILLLGTYLQWPYQVVS